MTTIRRFVMRSLDFRLGVRMLIKYPGLTIVGGAAIALGIAVGAVAFEFLTQAISPTIPLPDGGRIVALRLWDVETNREEPRALHDLAAWRGQLTSVEDVGAYRTVERNLGIGDAPGEPVDIAEITASAFRVVRVRPLMARGLIEADERPGAARALVIGYELWRRRFGGDPGIVGQTVRLGIYSILAFGVSRRTREIGIRIALGADARRIVVAVCSRAFAQVAAGVAAGGVLVFALTRVVTGLALKEVAAVVAYMALMLGVCLLACLVPIRRALRVNPTEALRAE